VFKSQDFRGRFPPILRGDGDETLVATDGIEALQKISEYLDGGQPVPNIIVTGGKPFALTGPQAKELLATSPARKGESAKKEVEKEGRSRSDREAATARIAEASRRASAVVQEQAARMQKPPERDAGLTR
ncbi:hypothetical protein, partial [Myxococcus llanfairpwllgwyngyllgogerychwyrndrobwllllantysiliogogogochensis]|uniref:hypothetical protein n=1 Tax=Myxococcus llanfairpwllgwyngyllgogerychwyrndrobwllllantysiliogogogochensis TaxID=2590453 RepID=UPI001C68400B